MSKVDCVLLWLITVCTPWRWTVATLRSGTVPAVPSASGVFLRSSMVEMRYSGVCTATW